MFLTLATNANPLCFISFHFISFGAAPDKSCQTSGGTCGILIPAGLKIDTPAQIFSHYHQD
jgi:hypothetical protein